MAKSRQVAALPVRLKKKQWQVMLVTSRDTGRWVLPKGWPWPHCSEAEAAAGEAWEEAGLQGKMQKARAGSFTYVKRMPTRNLDVKVNVYVMLVSKSGKTWPEKKQRRRKWFAISKAAELVSEAELKELMAKVERQLQHTK